MKSVNTLKSLLCACVLFLAPLSASASPPWWEGAPEDVPAAAAQTGKPVILYFHSPNAAECVRMQEETWDPMNPVWADLQFHWLKLEPRKDADFFKYWQINQVPQIVILDSQMRDQLRLRGFMSLDQVQESLERVQRTNPSSITTVSGSVLPASNPIQDIHAISRDPNKGHVYYENFDSYRLIGSISNPPFSPVSQAASRIDLKGGPDRSPCLVIDSADNGYSMIQIDASQSFPDVEQVLGRIRVRMKLKAGSSLGQVPVDVTALYVVRTDEVADKNLKEQMYFASLSNADRDRWRDKEIVSAPINLRLNKAFLIFTAQNPRINFSVDDIIVDLIPQDDFIPFVDTNSQVITLASMNRKESPEGATDDPDRFYERLADRAKVTQPTSVSNNLTRPTGSNVAAPQSANVNGTLAPEQVEEIGDMLIRSMDRTEHSDYLKSQGYGMVDRGKVMIYIHQKTKGK